MSTDLETRLRSLGEHLDAERAVVGAGTELATVVPFAPRRSPRLWWAAAAAVVLVVGLVAVFATRDDATQPTDSVPPTPAPTAPVTTDAPTETTVGQAEPPKSQPGDFTFDVTYRLDDGTSDRQRVVDWIGARGQALGLGTRVTDENPSDPTLRIVVSDVRSEDAAAVQRAFLDLGETIRFRPVTGECATPTVDTRLDTASDPSTEQLLPMVTRTPGGTVCTVGPAQADGSILAIAQVAPIDATTFAIDAELLPGAEGDGRFNALAAQCYDRRTTCPTGQIALEWGGLVYTAPTVQTPQFGGGNLQIAGDFSELQATALADQINRGPAPFSLTAVAP